MSELSDKLLEQMSIASLPSPVAEHQFFSGRRWKFDFAYPDKRIAIEVEGGMWSRGRHTRPLGFDGDCEKYSVAAATMWTVIRVTQKMINDGRALALVRLALTARDPTTTKKDYDDCCNVFRKKSQPRRKKNDKPRVQGNLRKATKPSTRTVNKK